MTEVSIIGLDLVKNDFQAHGANAAGAPIFRKKLRREQVLAFFAAHPPNHTTAISPTPTDSTHQGTALAGFTFVELTQILTDLNGANVEYEAGTSKYCDDVGIWEEGSAGC